MVVGASVAAEALTARLRKLGYDRDILVVERDARMPYERPPLSKQFLTDPDGTTIGVDWEQNVEFEYATALGLDVESQVLQLELLDSARKVSIGYERLVIATGATPFHLPIEPEGVLSLRTAQDAEQIRQAAQPGAHIGVIGAGAIGVEIASSLRALNVKVTLFDKADRPLERLLAGHLGETVQSWLEDLGVRCELSADLLRISNASHRWEVSLGDGRELEFDALISAVGANPNVAWLADSGLLTAGQLVCDEKGYVITQSGPLPNVFAAGDVVTRQSAEGALSRTESWTAASEQGLQLAEVLVGAEVFESEQPYFWTDVAGRKIQVLGALRSDALLEVVTENPDRGAKLFQATASDGSVGWLGINSPQAIAKLRMGDHFNDTSLASSLAGKG